MKRNEEGRKHGTRKDEGIFAVSSRIKLQNESHDDVIEIEITSLEFHHEYAE